MNKPLLPDPLRRLVPLNTLSARHLQQLRHQLEHRTLVAGEKLFDEAHPTGKSYFLVSGTLAIHGSEGESSLVAGSPESCHGISASTRLNSVRALEAATVLCIGSAQLDQLVSWHHANADVLLELATAGELTDWLETLLENPLFAKVPPANTREMLGRLSSIDLPTGYVLLREGDVGECCYFLKSGRAEVMTGLGSAGQVVAELDVGACFGEEALITDCPRNATVTLIEDACVLKLAREDFIGLLKAPVVDELSLDEAEALAAKGAQWLDVRMLDEYEHGHAANALNMPLHLLRLKTRLLELDRLYLCYCDSGKRSASAVFLLTQLGFSAYALRDGLVGLAAPAYAAFLCEQGRGYIARSGGRTERSV
jgi:CRP-like cAMP-binding protein